MFSAAKAKAKRVILIGSLLINAGFLIEHGVASYAIHTGLVQGQIKPPAVAFGGFDVMHEKQIAALDGMLPDAAVKAPTEKAVAPPLPVRKPLAR